MLGWYADFQNYPDLPSDLIDVPDEIYRDLLGKQIEVGPDGMPREYVPPPPSMDDTAALLLRAVDERLNAAARLKGYDSIVTAALRAGYPGPFHDEGVVFAQWMDQTYAHCYAVLADVQAGRRPVPTEAELMAELPAVPEFSGASNG